MGNPRKTPLERWWIGEVLPCMSVWARTTSPPKAWPMDWWPKQTPRMGIFPEKDWTASREMPALSGSHGPGEIRSLSGFDQRFQDRNRIVSVDIYLGAQNLKVLDNVPSKGIIVVNQADLQSPSEALVQGSQAVLRPCLGFLRILIGAKSRHNAGSYLKLPAFPCLPSAGAIARSVSPEKLTQPTAPP